MELKREYKNFWEIPGYKQEVSYFKLPLNDSVVTFCCNSFSDQGVYVYTVGDRIVGYYQPSWHEGIFLDVKGNFNYCMNRGKDGEVLPIYLRNFSNGVQWTSVYEDKADEEIFIRLV